MKINGFNARVTSEEKYLFLVPVADNHEGAKVPVEGRITSAVVRDAVAAVDFEVAYVSATHYRYVAYMLRSVMRERSGSYTRCAKWERNEAGTWAATRRTLENGIY